MILLATHLPYLLFRNLSQIGLHDIEHSRHITIL